MKFDIRLVTGIFIGVVVGLHYHTYLIIYLPVLTVATLVMLLKTIHR